jgi:hypothetical protein
MKTEDNGREAKDLFRTAPMCVTKESLAFVCSNACNEKTRKRISTEVGGGSKRKK